MVLDDPPAPAARVEFGFETCADDAPARRLNTSVRNNEYIVDSLGRASHAQSSTDRICAPEGLATALAGDAGRAESESDCTNSNY